MTKTVDKYQIQTAATTLPVSIQEAKDHLRITNSDQDALVEDLIWGATKSFEKRANVCLTEQKWWAFLDNAYEKITLWKYPITTIHSIHYYDDNNERQLLSSDDYFFSLDSSIGYNARPVTIYVEDLPSTYDRSDAFYISFTAGYSSLDYDVKQALLSWIWKKYENPDDDVREKNSFFDNIVSDQRSYGL